MQHAVKRPADPAGELSPSLHQGAIGLTPAHGGPAAGAPAPSERSGLSRRSVVATLVAAIAPAAVATAVALPVAPATAALAPSPAAESPALLALGIQLEERQSAYRLAVARLEQVRAVAADLWPEPPPSIVIISAADRRAFIDCFEQVKGIERQPLYRAIVDANGKVQPDAAALNVLRPDRLRARLAEIRENPDDWGGKRARQRLEADLTGRIVAAERYDAARAQAIEASGIQTATDAVRSEARKIHSLLYRIRQHAPSTVPGVLILARGMMLFEEVQKSSYCGGEQGRGLLMGRELAAAVLRIAGATAGSNQGTLATPS